MEPRNMASRMRIALPQAGLADTARLMKNPAWSSDKELGENWMPPENDEKLIPAKGYNQVGDQIESKIEGIGLLRNKVVAGA